MKTKAPLATWAARDVNPTGLPNPVPPATQLGGEMRLPEPPGPSAEDVFRDPIEWIKASQDYDRPDNPPAWVADEATWERAKKAVEPYWDRYSEPYAVVVHIYENMGGTVK